MQGIRRSGIVLLGTGLVIGFLIARAGMKVETFVGAAGSKTDGATAQWASGRASLTDPTGMGPSV